MKIIDPRHVHEIVLCKEPHTVPNAAYCTQIRTLCQLMWIICKAKYRGILSRVTLRLQRFIQQRQISFWAGKKELYDLLVELFWFKCSAANADRKSKTHVRDQQQWPFSSIRCRRCWGWALTVAEQGQGTQAMLSSNCTAALGMQPGLPPSSPHHLPTPASMQLCPKVTESDRAAGMTGRWHPHSLPTADDRHTSGGSSLFLG